MAMLNQGEVLIHRVFPSGTFDLNPFSTKLRHKDLAYVFGSPWSGDGRIHGIKISFGERDNPVISDAILKRINVIFGDGFPEWEGGKEFDLEGPIGIVDHQGRRFVVSPVVTISFLPS